MIQMLNFILFLPSLNLGRPYITKGFFYKPERMKENSVIFHTILPAIHEKNKNKQVLEIIILSTVIDGKHLAFLLKRVIITIMIS